MEWHWETQKKNWGKKELAQDKWYYQMEHKLEYLEHLVQGEADLQIYVEQTRGLSRWTSPIVPKWVDKTWIMVEFIELVRNPIN